MRRTLATPTQCPGCKDTVSDTYDPEGYRPQAAVAGDFRLCETCGTISRLDKSMQLVTCTDHDVFFALSPGMRRDLLEAQQEVLDRLAQAN
jgi:hypothetical protein